MRLLLDENFNNDILRGLLRRNPDINVLRVQDIPEIASKSDPEVLEWAARENYIIFTHDVQTMTHYAYERVRQSQAMPGVFEVKRTHPLGEIIEEILLLIECSVDGEWEGHVLYLPF